MNKRVQNQLIRTALIGLLILFAAWISSPWHNEVRIGNIQRDLSVRLGLDLQGGSHLVYRANIEESGTDDPAQALIGVRDIIERRVNAFGIADPIVQTNRVGDEYRVIVELAGVHDPEEAKELIGATPQLDFRVERDTEEEQPVNTDEMLGLDTMFAPTELSGRHLRRAGVGFDPVTNIPHVELEFDREGAALFADITGENIGRRLAIYLDGMPINAPVVQAEITGGSAIITGSYSVEEARELARHLNSGALPVSIELIGQQTIGPTLGELSVQQSMQAGMIGIVAVMIWMILYYRIPGIVASIALLIYTALFIAIIKLIPVTLTLAGIAGFILSIGMAVDANVLIFERFRENLRKGKTTRYALEDGFKNAWDSIKASNISSLITGIILYAFGTSIVRGFALTFSIGILLSMFTAVVITKDLLSYVLTWKQTRKSALLGAPVKSSHT